MKRRTRVIGAFIAASALFAAACSDDSSSSDTTSASTEAPGTTGATETTEGTDTTEPMTTDSMPMDDMWMVDTDLCVDPDAANAPIEGTINVASVMPLTGGAAAAAFEPVARGMQAYIDYANENGLLGDLQIELTIEDDQYNAELTPGAVAARLDDGADIFSGIIGSANNAAVRDTLNQNCIPQLNNLTGSPLWGDVANYPWTTGQLVPYTIESKVYAANIREQHPDGAKVALFNVNNEFGQVHVDAFNEIADEFGIEIVGQETIEATDQAPPTAQITNIAALAPDAIMAVPLGAQCIGFLTEVANAKAANPGWDPQVYITNTCASSLILGASGAAADGLYTSGNGIDVVNPANADIPEVAEYLAYMDSKGLSDIAATAATGWTTGEITVAILKQAMESPEGLTRASIINAARNFDFHASLLLPGINYKLSGETDVYLAESLIVRQYDADTATFTDIGDVVTEFES